ncbi:hypothetical protein Tco_0386271 [Tanacetum coccineum]
MSDECEGQGRTSKAIGTASTTRDYPVEGGKYHDGLSSPKIPSRRKILDTICVIVTDLQKICSLLANKENDPLDSWQRVN